MDEGNGGGPAWLRDRPRVRSRVPLSLVPARRWQDGHPWRLIQGLPSPLQPRSPRSQGRVFPAAHSLPSSTSLPSQPVRGTGRGFRGSTGVSGTRPHDNPALEGPVTEGGGLELRDPHPLQ